MTWPTSWGPAPRWATPRDPSRASYGPVVGRLTQKLLGVALHPWQQYVLDVALEVLPEGGWAYEEVLTTVPRQSGKTFLFAPLVAHRMGRADDRQAWITAQTGDKAVARWSIASKAITKSGRLPGVRQLVSTSHERTVWPNGSFFRPFAPKEGAVDGETPDLLLVDELWAFDGEDQEAMENSYGPAVFMNPWGQLMKFSTAGTQRSSWLNADRERGRAAVESGRGRMAFFEWSIPEVVDGQQVDKLNDERIVELVLAHHPLTGRHPKVTRDRLLNEISKSTRARQQFIRGMGNLTQEVRGDGLVPDDVWRRTTARALIPAGVRVGIGFQVDELGRETTIYAGYRDPESGVGVVELIEQGSGSGWVASRLRNLEERWNPGAIACHYSGPSRAAADAAIRLGVDILKVYTPDMGAANTRFLEDLDRERQLHDGARGPEITRAMKAAQSRQLQAGPMFESAGVDPITALPAASLAMWATDHLPETPERIPFMIR
jgi:hypothetical protein